MVGKTQRPLWHHDEDLLRGDPISKKATNASDGRGRLSRSGNALQEEASLDWSLDDFPLPSCQIQNMDLPL